METGGLHAKIDERGLWYHCFYSGSTEAAKMRGYDVTGHTDPEVSHCPAEMETEDSKETFGMVLYLK